MSRIIPLLTVLVLVLGLKTTLAVAQQEGGAGGITITLVDAKGTAVSTCATKDDGTWSLSVPQPGDYSLIVSEAELANARAIIADRFAVSTPASPSSSAASINFSWTMKDDAAVSCVVSARDSVTGMPAGKPRRTAVMFVREFDKMVPTISTTKAMAISGNLSFTVKPSRK